MIVTLDAASENIRRTWIVLGILWGVTALTNPALLSLLPFSYAYAFFPRTPRPWKDALLSAALCCAIVLPWAVRNDVVFGRPVFLRSNFWFEFHLGNYHYSN